VGVGGCINRDRGVTGGRLRLLLGSACMSALLLGSGTTPVVAAACTPNDVSGSAGAGPFNNTGAITCINIQNSTVNGGTGNVSNGTLGIITTTGASQNTGIRINNSTLTGSVINSGTITAPTGSSGNFGNGIVITTGASVAGGITNSGTITAKSGGIEDGVVGFGLTFSAGITNSGTIVVTTSLFGAGISAASVSTFTGGITNSGTITAKIGIDTAMISTFSGGVVNSGTINASQPTLGIPIGIVIDGTGHVVGASPATFTGGVTNLGVISGGIGVEDISTFTGGNISNNGSVSSTHNGIVLTNVVTYTGSVVNSGTVSAAGAGIFVGLTQFSSGGVATFTGNIVNSGSLTAQTGIGVASSTIHGQIIVTGNVQATSRGIFIDSASTIASTATAVQIFSPTFTGGVSNAGTITTSGASGIEVNSVRTFTGGITNTGLIAANTHALSVAAVSTFAGGISNNGTLTATNSVLLVSSVAVFGTNATGGITNTGTIAGNGAAAGINVLNIGAFNGGIVNGGLINNLRTGISMSAVSSFAGGITNTASGRINASVFGIALTGVSTFIGNVSNAGTITGQTGIRIGAGVTFFGGAIINTGTITGTSAAIDVTGMTSAVTILQAGGTLNGAVKLAANFDVFDITGGIINGNIVGAGTHDTVNFNPGAGNTFTYNSNFTGINQVNILSGTAVLNGANSATKVDVLGGTLAGTGSITSPLVTIHAGGTFAPGTPGTPGTKMSINGALTFQPGATYQIYLNPSATTSATISGAVSLNGTVQANFAAGSYMNHSYDILHSGGLGGTTFTGLTTVPANFNASLSYTSTDVFLNLTAELGQGASLTVNQQNVATALNTFFNNGGTLPPGFAAVFGLNGTNLASALNQLDGEVATGAQRAAFQIGSEFLSLLIDPFLYGRGDAFASAHGGVLGFAPQDQESLPADTALAYASLLKAPPLRAPAEQRWTAWGSVYGGQASAKGDPNVVGSTNVTTGTFGFAGGMDYRVNADTVAGFGLGAGGTGWGLAQGIGNGRSDALQAGIYGATHWGPAYAAASAAFAESWMHTSRTALGDHLTADFDGQGFGARFEAGYRYPVTLATATLGVAPYVALQTQWFRTPGYSERDLVAGGFGLTYQAMTTNDTRGELGARVDHLVSLGGMPLLLRGRLAWAHDWISNPALNAVFQALPGTNFTVFGAPVAHDSALASAGAEWRITPRLDLIAKFDGEFAAGAQTYAGSATLRYRW
jgi:uncharacterized protein with beta-barrel porin domain